MPRCCNCQDPLHGLDTELCLACSQLDPSQHGSRCSCSTCEPPFGEEPDSSYWRRASADGRPM